jgi:hypothetical protein
MVDAAEVAEEVGVEEALTRVVDVVAEEEVVIVMHVLVLYS